MSAFICLLMLQQMIFQDSKPPLAIKDDPALPRVLIIGDSISIGYTPDVQVILKGKANVHRVPGNASSTGFGLTNLDKWLGKDPWTVIHFNFGLHDAKLPPEGVRHSPPEVYEKNLKAIITRLKKTNARLIFATTTPVPNGGNLAPDRKFGNVDRYNEIALKVMKDEGVTIDDLNKVITPLLGKMQKPNDVHFNRDGSRVLGESVAKSILDVLPSKKP